MLSIFNFPLVVQELFQLFLVQNGHRCICFWFGQLIFFFSYFSEICSVESQAWRFDVETLLVKFVLLFGLVIIISQFTMALFLINGTNDIPDFQLIEALTTSQHFIHRLVHYRPGGIIRTLHRNRRTVSLLHEIRIELAHTTHLKFRGSLGLFR